MSARRAPAGVNPSYYAEGRPEEALEEIRRARGKKEKKAPATPAFKTPSPGAGPQVGASQRAAGGTKHAHLSLSVEAAAKLNKLRRKWGMSKSMIVDLLIREADERGARFNVGQGVADTNEIDADAVAEAAASAVREALRR